MGIKWILKIICRDIIINSIAASYILPGNIRRILYKIYGIKLDNAYISPKCFFSGNNIIIGSDSYFNYGCWFDNSSKISIGKNCFIGINVKFITSNHDIGGPNHRAGKLFGEPIKVGDGCWLGSNVTVLPGITIGNGCVIAAGAVVSRDCASNGLYGGVPARRIKDLPFDDN